MQSANAPKQSKTENTNKFYRDHYHQIILGLIGLIFLLIVGLGIIFYQLVTRPLPELQAMQPDNQRKVLTPFKQPNLLADTILRWASKAATFAYTYDFVNYEKQKQLAKPFFTEEGWRDYERSITNVLIDDIVRNKLIVNGVVAGVPLISNQGELPEKGYSWRVQIPFIATFQSADSSRKQNFQITLTIVQIPTTVNPQGIGIDQFVMR